jgi:carotenoid cleavage dioxygenase
MDRARNGLPPYAWEKDKKSYIGVMRRDGSARDIRWFQGEACYVFHLMNAWEQDGHIVADVMRRESPALFPNADGTPGDPARQQASLARWTFDLAEGNETFTTTYLDDLAGEFPRIDDRRAGRPNRHGWFAATTAPVGDGTFNAIAHIDQLSGKRGLYHLRNGDATSEPVFVPRSADAPEGDGWLLAVLWRSMENRSDLAVFNATDIQRGPIATVELSARVPFGLHGNWVATN